MARRVGRRTSGELCSSSDRRARAGRRHPTEVAVDDVVQRLVERRGSELAHAEVEASWAARERAAVE
jgi:hypothetical protein